MIDARRQRAADASRSATRCWRRASGSAASSAGGGGYGDPLDRDPEAVLEDVLEGWVSLERAEAVYGVVFSGQASDESLVVDVAATLSRRQAQRGDRDE